MRYAAAGLRTAVALGLGRTLKPILGDVVSSMVLFPAMAFAAWRCGVGPSILATVLTLTERLIESQDDERRRIGRELHDSVGQTLAALSMNLTKVEADIERLNQTTRTIADSSSLVQEMNKEIRTISYLLHPPMLDEAGLRSALRW